MFKGLKSKLEDEAKRLQATVSHYGENIANQVRSSAVCLLFYELVVNYQKFCQSEAGSDISGRGRKLFGNAPDAVQQQPAGESKSNDETLISFNDEEGAETTTDIMTAHNTTERRLSIESNERQISKKNQEFHF